MLVDLLKMSKIMVDFVSFFEKSMEYYAPNTDWHLRFDHFKSKPTNWLKWTYSDTWEMLVN